MIKYPDLEAAWKRDKNSPMVYFPITGILLSFT